MSKSQKSRQVGVRVPVDVWARLEKAADTSIDPYAPSITQIVLQGIELALAERARMRSEL